MRKIYIFKINFIKFNSNFNLFLLIFHFFFKTWNNILVLLHTRKLTYVTVKKITKDLLYFLWIINVIFKECCEKNCLVYVEFQCSNCFNININIIHICACVYIYISRNIYTPSFFPVFSYPLIIFNFKKFDIVLFFILLFIF